MHKVQAYNYHSLYLTFWVPSFRNSVHFLNPWRSAIDLHVMEVNQLKDWFDWSGSSCDAKSIQMRLRMLIL